MDKEYFIIAKCVIRANVSLMSQERLNNLLGESFSAATDIKKRPAVFETDTRAL